MADNSKDKLNKKEDKNIIAVIVIIGILVIILGVVSVYAFRLRNELKKQLEINELSQHNLEIKKENTEKTSSEQSKKTQEKEEIYTSKDVKGTYIAKATLNLFEDGTYDYEDNSDAAYGYYGTYTIDGDKIILNQMFSHGSDVGINPEKKQINGTINKDGSITLKLKETTTFNKKSSSNSDSYDSLYEAVKGYIEYLEEKAK